ncbi:HK97 family phage prohead protease [Pleomorphomonas sp. PLEO]|uniref:HK97 family phage prohead protease n=1 Tax=Pleomorphomonas sp. PLEO TaxID=3239306 RepID=UPI00351DDA48
MPKIISPDEYREKRKDFCRSDGTVLKAVAFKAPPSWDPEKRTARFIMSTEEPDRDRDIVVQAGIDLTNFLKNPVALYRHYSEFPIGNWSALSLITAGRPKRTEGDLNFLAEEVDEDADRCARHVAAGSLKAVSIGFLPKKLRQRERDEDSNWPGYEITESELVECSLCTIPAQPGALAKMADHDAKLARLEIEEVLDSWALDPVTRLLTPRKDYEAAYKVISAKAFADLIPKAADEPPPPPATDAKEGGDQSSEAGVAAKDGGEEDGGEGCGEGDEPEMDEAGCQPKPKAEDAKSEDSLVHRIVTAITKILKPQPPEPPAPPSEADIASAKKAANETLQRLKDAGLITD